MFQAYHKEMAQEKKLPLKYKSNNWQALNKKSGEMDGSISLT